MWKTPQPPYRRFCKLNLGYYLALQETAPAGAEATWLSSVLHIWKAGYSNFRNKFAESAWGSKVMIQWQTLLTKNRLSQVKLTVASNFFVCFFMNSSNLAFMCYLCQYYTFNTFFPQSLIRFVLFAGTFGNISCSGK